MAVEEKHPTEKVNAAFNRIRALARRARDACDINNDPGIVEYLAIAITRADWEQLKASSLIPHIDVGVGRFSLRFYGVRVIVDDNVLMAVQVNARA
jgi:hypothetical protein